MTTVLIADDQPLQRMGFRMLMEGTPGLSPIGEAEHGAEA
ncbi:DNA-binding response regulator, partial [Streptomyces sp. 2MCAF27]